MTFKQNLLNHFMDYFDENSTSLTIDDLKKIIKELEDQSCGFSLKDSVLDAIIQMENAQQKQELTIKSINESIEQIKKQQDLFENLMNESMEQLKKNQHLLSKSVNQPKYSSIKDSISQMEEQHGSFKIQLEKLQNQNGLDHDKFISICNNFKNLSAKM